MPIYDYVCESCGHVVEVIHAISAPGPSTCERCGGTLKRALSTPAIVFKGSGWAKKDARDAVRSKATTAKPPDGGTTADAGAPQATGGGGAGASEAPGGSAGQGASEDTPVTSGSSSATPTRAAGGSSAASD